MTTQEQIEGNKRIAEFMGVKIGVDKYSWRPGCSDPLEEKHLAYHSSWGWLMAVVEKIEATHDDYHGYFAVIISSNGCVIQGTKLRTDPENYHPAYFNQVYGETKLKATYAAVLQFLEGIE